MEEEKSFEDYKQEEEVERKATKMAEEIVGILVDNEGTLNECLLTLGVVLKTIIDTYVSEWDEKQRSQYIDDILASYNELLKAKL